MCVRRITRIDDTSRIRKTYRYMGPQMKTFIRVLGLVSIILGNAGIARSEDPLPFYLHCGKCASTVAALEKLRNTSHFYSCGYVQLYRIKLCLAHDSSITSCLVQNESATTTLNFSTQGMDKDTVFLVGPSGEALTFNFKKAVGTYSMTSLRMTKAVGSTVFSKLCTCSVQMLPSQ